MGMRRRKYNDNDNDDVDATPLDALIASSTTDEATLRVLARLEAVSQRYSRAVERVEDVAERMVELEEENEEH